MIKRFFLIFSRISKRESRLFSCRFSYECRVLRSSEKENFIEKNNKDNEEELNSLNNLTLEEHYNFYEKRGLNKKEIIKKIAKDRNVSKNEIYQYFI